MFAAVLGLAWSGIALAQDTPAEAPAAAAPAAGGGSAAEEKPQTLKERSGYAYGVIIGKQMKESGIEIDIDQFAKALGDIFAEIEPALTEDEIKSTFDEAREVAEKMKAEEGTRWLAENGKKEGIKTTDSGLQYEVLKAGEGKNPAATDQVTVHYKGTLLNGTEFDSSYSRGEPATFPLNRVIAGWTEGLQLMKPGAKFRFFIPQDLAYGEQGSPPKIPPFSALIFEVELLGVNQ